MPWSSRASRRAAISARCRPACWRRRSCRRSARCRSSSPAASAAARRSLVSRDGRVGLPARHALRLRHRIDRPSRLQAGVHPRQRPRRGGLRPDRSRLAGDPGARARQRRQQALHRDPAPGGRRATGGRDQPGGGTARDRAILGRRAEARGHRRRRRERLADGRAERRHGDARGSRPPRSSTSWSTRRWRRSAQPAACGRSANAMAIRADRPRPAPSSRPHPRRHGRRGHRRRGSPGSSRSSPRTWPPRCARSMCAAPATCSSCSRRKD